MMTFAIFIVGTWVGFGLGLAFAGFGRMLSQPGVKQQIEHKSSEFNGGHDLAIAAHGADRR